MQSFEFHSCLVSSLCKVLPNHAPEGGKIESVEGLWGETLSFQLAFTTQCDGRNYSENLVRVELESPLKDCIRMRSVVNVPVMLPSCGESDDYYLSHEAGMFPDLLQSLPAFRIRAIPGQWRALWFDLTLTQDMPAKAAIVLKVYGVNDVLLACHTLMVNIVPAALPEQTLLHTQWFHGDCLADYYGVEVFSERHWTIMENFLQEAGCHGINMILTPIFTPPLDTGVDMERTTIQLVDVYCENGIYSFHFERLERFVRLCQTCGLRYFEMAHLFTQWGAGFAPKIMVSENGILNKKFGWHTPAMSTEYQDFLQTFLPALTGCLTRLGVADQTYFHISDEPEPANLESYRKAADFVKPFLKGFKTLDALSDYEFYRTGCVKRPIVSNDHVDFFIENGVKGLWTYYCTAQGKNVANRFIAMPSARNRILGVQLYLYDIEGFLQWGYNFYNSQHSISIINPYCITDSGDAFQAGDPYLVYPGPDGIPEESIRLMSTCEALFDLRALGLLEQKRSRGFVDALLHEDLEYRITFQKYPRGEAWLLHMRARVNEALRNAL